MNASTPGREAIDRRDLSGPFDLVGDVHGCFDELALLLERLGYEVDADEAAPRATPPAGRRLVFLGDLADRGPKCPAVLRLAMAMVAAGTALCVLGNHDEKLLRKLRGRDVDTAWGLAETLAQLEGSGATFLAELEAFLANLVPHHLLDGGALVVAHAGLREECHGQDGPRARAFGLYGEPTGQVDELGFPIRKDWAADYAGEALVAYGHTPVEEARWSNNTVNLDTGCVYGGKLSALRYPERELVEVPARRLYWSRREEREAAARGRG